jgi:hypothetical protein
MRTLVALQEDLSEDILKWASVVEVRTVKCVIRDSGDEKPSSFPQKVILAAQKIIF